MRCGGRTATTNTARANSTSEMMIIIVITIRRIMRIRIRRGGTGELEEMTAFIFFFAPSPPAVYAVALPPSTMSLLFLFFSVKT